MAVSVGGVMVEFDGDASGAAAAMKAVSEKLDELVAKEKNLKTALDAATASGNASEIALRALRSAHAEAQTAVDRLTGKLAEEAAAEKAVAKATKDAEKTAKDAEKAARDQAKASEKAAEDARKFADSHGHLGEKARKVDEIFGALQTSSGGVAQAFGTQASAITDVVGAGADIAKSFGTGGPMLAALTAATAGVAILIDKFDLFGTKAEEAAKKARKALDDLDEKAAGIRLGTAAKLAGESSEVFGQRRSVERAQQEVSMAELRAGEVGGGAVSLESMRGAISRGDWVPTGGKEAVDRWIAATKKLEKEQNVLSALLEDSGVDESLKKQNEFIAKGLKAQEEYEQALREAAEALLAQKINATIRKIDADKARQEIDTELSQGQYTAEDRASRESRGVTEVSQPIYDALASVDFEPPDTSKIESASDVASTGLLQLKSNVFSTSEGMQNFGAKLDVTDGSLKLFGDNLDSMALEINAKVAEIDFRSIEQKFNDAMKAAGDAATAAFEKVGGGEGIAKAAIQGGASGAGQALGGVAGAAIGTAVGGPAGTGIGSALGSMLGGLLGESLDKLIESLGILTPLFDAIGVVIGALQPILVVLGGLFVTIGDAIISLTPIILILARLFGSNIAIFVRLLQVVLMVVPLISLLASVILVWVDGLVLAFGWIDEMFLTPLADAVIEFVNVVIMAYNGIIDFIRNIPGFEEFGTKAEYMTRDESAFVGVGDMINDVKEAATLRAEESTTGGGAGDGGGGEETKTGDSWGQEMTNVPSGFKSMAAIYANADPGVGPGGMFSHDMAKSMIVNIQNWNSKGDSQRDFDDLRRLARNGHKGKKAASSKFAGDEKN